MRGPRPSISGDKNPNFGKRPMFGKTHSEKTRHKISLSQIGKHPSEETRRKLRLTCTPMRRLRIKLARESRRNAEKMFMTGTFHIPEQEWMSGCLRHSIDIK
jgi:hypothetical protein